MIKLKACFFENLLIYYGKLINKKYQAMADKILAFKSAGEITDSKTLFQQISKEIECMKNQETKSRYKIIDDRIIIGRDSSNNTDRTVKMLTVMKAGYDVIFSCDIQEQDRHGSIKSLEDFKAVFRLWEDDVLSPDDTPSAKTKHEEPDNTLS